MGPESGGNRRTLAERFAGNLRQIGCPRTHPDGIYQTVDLYVGRGFRIKLKRDEVDAYLDGALPAVKKLRIRKGRLKQ